MARVDSLPSARPDPFTHPPQPPLESLPLHRQIVSHPRVPVHASPGASRTSVLFPDRSRLGESLAYLHVPTPIPANLSPPAAVRRRSPPCTAGQLPILLVLARPARGLRLLCPRRAAPGENAPSSPPLTHTKPCHAPPREFHALSVPFLAFARTVPPLTALRACPCSLHPPPLPLSSSSGPSHRQQLFCACEPLRVRVRALHPRRIATVSDIKVPLRALIAQPSSEPRPPRGPIRPSITPPASNISNPTVRYRPSALSHCLRSVYRDVRIRPAHPRTSSLARSARKYVPVRGRACPHNRAQTPDAGPLSPRLFFVHQRVDPAPQAPSGFVRCLARLLSRGRRLAAAEAVRLSPSAHMDRRACAGPGPTALAFAEQ